MGGRPPGRPRSDARRGSGPGPARRLVRPSAGCRGTRLLDTPSGRPSPASPLTRKRRGPQQRSGTSNSLGAGQYPYALEMVAGPPGRCRSEASLLFRVRPSSSIVLSWVGTTIPSTHRRRISRSPRSGAHRLVVAGDARAMTGVPHGGEPDPDGLMIGSKRHAQKGAQ